MSVIKDREGWISDDSYLWTNDDNEIRGLWIPSTYTSSGIDFTSNNKKIYFQSKNKR